MRIYLIRHGQTDWNIQGKIQGSHDIPLNNTGRKQAELLAKGMDSHPVKKIFSSTLSRAAETAKLIGERQKVDIYLMPDLIEVEFGKWEGMTWDQIKASYPVEYQQWNLNPVEVAPPGGETQLAVVKRCAEALKEILQMTEGKEDVAIVSHGATIAHLIAYMLKGQSEETEIIVGNASITTLEYEPVTGEFSLVEMNDVGHLIF